MLTTQALHEIVPDYLVSPRYVPLPVVSPLAKTSVEVRRFSYLALLFTSKRRQSRLSPKIAMVWMWAVFYPDS